MTSSRTPSPSSASEVAGLHIFPVRFSSRYSSVHYIPQEGAQPDVRCFIALPTHPIRQLILHNHHSQDTPQVLGASNWSISREGRGGHELRTVSAQKDIPFVRYEEEVIYQRQLARLLIRWRCDKTVPTVPWVALLLPQQRTQLATACR